MNEAILLRLAVEDFVYREAALLDDWNLKDWLALFGPTARYEVAPTGDPEAGTLSSAESLFLVADDREGDVEKDQERRFTLVEGSPQQEQDPEQRERNHQL